MKRQPPAFIALALLTVSACGTSPGTTGETEAGGGTFEDVGTEDTGTGAEDTGTADVGSSDTGTDGTGTVDTGVPDVSPPPDGGIDATDDTGPDARPDVPPSTLAESCEAACEAREERTSGGCPVSQEQECADWCIELGPNVDPDLKDAYFQCLSEDPLCFQTMLQCALGLGYPEPLAHTVTLRGSGYDEWEGQRVFAAVQQSAGDFLPGEGIVQEGAFELTFDVVMHVSASHLTLFYVDVNDNGACDADADETGSQGIDLWSLPDDVITLPEWLIEAAYDPATDMGFVCDYLD